MSVAVVHVINGLEVAGAERAMSEIARSLPRDEFDVSVLVVRDGPLHRELDRADLPVTVVGGDFDWRWPGVIARMAAYMRRVRPQIVHTHLIGGDIVGGLAARIARVPIILSTQHDIIRRPAIYDLYRRYSSRWLSAVVPVAPSMRDYCVHELHMSPSRIHPIVNGIDAARFASIPKTRGEKIVFGCVGRLVSLKGHDVAIRAFARVHESMSNTMLLIAGEGPERHDLERLVSELGLQDAVGILGNVDDIAAFLAEVDILVHPSIQEGLPLAILEGMAARRPVIASALPAISDASDGGRCARLFTPGDVEGCAEQMLALARDEELASRIAVAGNQKVLTDFSPARMAEEYVALYRRLLAGRPLAVGEDAAVERS